MSVVEGQAGDGRTYVLPLNADGTAVAVEAGSALLVTGSATATNQTNGSQKTQVVDGSGNVAPAGDTLARASFAKTASAASASTDPGQNLSLSDTNAHAFGTSAAATFGVLVSAPAENTATVYVGLGSGVTAGATGKGKPLVPGADCWFPGVLNSNLIYCITGTATQNVHALAI